MIVYGREAYRMPLEGTYTRYLRHEPLASRAFCCASSLTCLISKICNHSRVKFKLWAHNDIPFPSISSSHTVIWKTLGEKENEVVVHKSLLRLGERIRRKRWHT